MIITLETERLLIRDFIAEDLKAVHIYASSPLVTQHMIWGPNTEDDTMAFIQRAIEMQGQMINLEAGLKIKTTLDNLDKLTRIYAIVGSVKK